MLLKVRICGLGAPPWLHTRCLSSSSVSRGKEAKLFTPGPLSTSPSVKAAMLRDVGSRDSEFIGVVRYIRRTLLEIAGVPSETHTTIPLQGSGTYAIEAVLQNVVPKRGGKLLILNNGAYGERMATICKICNIPYHELIFPETERVDVGKVQAHLQQQGKEYSAVGTVHCETSSGVINPIREIGKVIKAANPNGIYIVDAMSSFGGVPIDMSLYNIDYMVSSANKCLQGIPGFSFVIANKKHLASCDGNCPSLVLDLVKQVKQLELNGQFRFTPPTHSMLAMKKALQELEQEGWVDGRSKRYKENCDILQSGMQALGFQRLLDDSHKGYVITAFHYPNDPKFLFPDFYKGLIQLGRVIYPGKVTSANSFRIGTIGHIFPDDVQELLRCIALTLADMGVKLPLSSSSTSATALPPRAATVA